MILNTSLFYNEFPPLLMDPLGSLMIVGDLRYDKVALSFRASCEKLDSFKVSSQFSSGSMVVSPLCNFGAMVQE